MIVLGIESSCDETAAAVLREGTTILSNIVASQIEVHRPYGGVVPELASRHHIRNIVPVVDEALRLAGCALSDLDGIAVTKGPGLAGALLVGVQMAKALAYVHRKPLVGIHHLEGHLCASTLGSPELQDNARYVALLVSGGHTSLVLVEGFGHYRLLGATRDDAAGEAFDKVAKLLRIGYPGGPIIEKLSASGNPHAIRFPRALPRRDELDFSFSGLKTAVVDYVRSRPMPEGDELADLCASFQAAIIDVLIRKSLHALKSQHAIILVAAGGVLANQTLRQALAAALLAEGKTLVVPPVSLCTDNGVMIAAAGDRRLCSGERSHDDMQIEPRWVL